MTTISLPEITLTVRVKREPGSAPTVIRSSSDLHKVAMQIFNADTIDWREEAMLICLNKKNEVMGFFKIGSGGTDAVIMDSRIVYTVALNCLANAVVVIHNHPSGTLRPSQPDIDVTKRLKHWGDTLGIPLIDHLIITSDGFYSFLDNGLI